MVTYKHHVTKKQLEDGLLNAGYDTTKQDRVFQSIAREQWGMLMPSRKYEKSAKLWQEVLDRTLNWESNNYRVHKGTLYYFYAVTFLLARDSERGFLLMHKALKEDIITDRTTANNLPAWKFVTLDYTAKDQYMEPLVVVLSGQLNRFLKIYRTRTSLHLTLEQFKSKFLEQIELKDPVFSFVHEISQMHQLFNTFNSNIFSSAFGSFRLVNKIFALCLITDAVIDFKTSVGYQFIDKATKLAEISNMNLTKAQIGEFNGQFKSRFETLVTELLTDDSKPLEMELSPIERSLLVTYGFRNFAAHRIEEQRTVINYYEKITQSILNTLFLSIEKLY